MYCSQSQRDLIHVLLFTYECPHSFRIFFCFLTSICYIACATGLARDHSFSWLLQPSYRWLLASACKVFPWSYTFWWTLDCKYFLVTHLSYTCSQQVWSAWLFSKEMIRKNIVQQLMNWSGHQIALDRWHVSILQVWVF